MYSYPELLVEKAALPLPGAGRFSSFSLLHLSRGSLLQSPCWTHGFGFRSWFCMRFLLSLLKVQTLVLRACITFDHSLSHCTQTHCLGGGISLCLFFCFLFSPKRNSLIMLSYFILLYSKFICICSISLQHHVSQTGCLLPVLLLN